MTEIKHEEHDVEIKFSTANTKHIKTVTVTLRGDLDTLDNIDAMVKKIKSVWGELN